MDITHSLIHLSRQRSRSRTRNSTANSRSTSLSRRPSLTGLKRSLSSTSQSRLLITPTAIDFSNEKTIPTISLNLDTTLPLDFFKDELIGLIKALRISKWHKRNLVPDNIGVTRILGALTNSIFKIEYRGSADSDAQVPLLLLRVYGKNVDNLIDRDLELSILIRLSSKKIGPKLLGIFGNGRFEQFLEGFETLGKDCLRDAVISQMIARRMKDLHYKIALEESEKTLEFPVSWIQIMKWIAIFEATLLPSMSEEKLEEILLVPWKTYRNLVFAYRDWLFLKYDEDNLQDNFRFCHNDTQYGNLLLKSTFDYNDVVQSNPDLTALTTNTTRDHDLAVIDFEYLGPNFPAYDIADHFSEWMSDYHNEEKPHHIYEDKYPTQVEQFNLLKSYVEYNFQYPTSNLKTKTQLKADESAIQTLIEFEVRKLYNENIMWRSTVQFFWLIWGLIQNGPLNTDLNVLGYKCEERGVNGTYEFSAGIEALSLGREGLPAVDDEELDLGDEDFDYLKYTQQKAALIAGDMIQFGLLDIEEIKPENRGMIKYLDAKMFDI